MTTGPCISAYFSLRAADFLFFRLLDRSSLARYLEFLDTSRFPSYPPRGPFLRKPSRSQRPSEFPWRYPPFPSGLQLACFSDFFVWPLFPIANLPFSPFPHPLDLKSRCSSTVTRGVRGESVAYHGGREQSAAIRDLGLLLALRLYLGSSGGLLPAHLPGLPVVPLFTPISSLRRLSPGAFDLDCVRARCAAARCCFLIPYRL